MLPYASIRFQTLPYASICFHTLPYASICFHMLPYASIRFRFHALPYASIYFSSDFIRFHMLPCASISFPHAYMRSQNASICFPCTSITSICFHVLPTCSRATYPSHSTPRWVPPTGPTSKHRDETSTSRWEKRPPLHSIVYGSGAYITGLGFMFSGLRFTVYGLRFRV
jgi:hypothetical protein